jgi:FtsH-binding integral membrane protein
MKVSTKIIEQDASLDHEGKSLKQKEELEQEQEQEYEHEHEHEHEDISEYKHDNESVQMKVEIRISDEGYQVEEEEEEIEDQSIHIEASVRNGFIRKVYGILSIQLIITFGFVLLFQLPSIKKAILSNIQLAGNILIFTSFLFFFLFLILACCRNLSRTVPYNYIFLLSITLCEAISCAIISSCYSFQIVSIALLLTIVTTLTITFYACTTKTDFSYSRVILLIAFSQLFMVGLVSVIFQFRILYSLYTFLSTIMLGFYLVYDTQLIIGKFGYGYSVDDYIFAAMEIYMDIIRLFLMILRLLAEVSSKKH